MDIGRPPSFSGTTRPRPEGLCIIRTACDYVSLDVGGEDADGILVVREAHTDPSEPRRRSVVRWLMNAQRMAPNEMESVSACRSGYKDRRGGCVGRASFTGDGA